jgi:hypothetical protein
MAAGASEIDRLDLRTISVEPDDGGNLLVVHAPDVRGYSPYVHEGLFSEENLSRGGREGLGQVPT